LEQYALVSTFYIKNYANWEKACDLYVIRGLTNATYEEISSAETEAKMEALYIPFNRNGGMMTDFYDFTPGYQSMNTATSVVDGDRILRRYSSATVNPNYLKEFPIYNRALPPFVWMYEVA